jgi:hypothetical protein
MAKADDGDSKKTKHEHAYWRVLVTYSDNETSGNRVFKDRAKAEKFAARQKKSGVVKKAVVESFVRQQTPDAEFPSSPTPIPRTIRT